MIPFSSDVKFLIEHGADVHGFALIPFSSDVKYIASAVASGLGFALIPFSSDVKWQSLTRSGASFYQN